MEHYTCRDCGTEFTDRLRSKTLCPSCTGRRGAAVRKLKAWPNTIIPKEAKLHPGGYLYYSQMMCTPDEIALLPGSNRCILVHRLIMAQHLGRPLQPNEVVMHIDGNKLNNAIDNLQVGSSLENTSQHWKARQDAAFWRNAAVSIFLALSPRS